VILLRLWALAAHAEGLEKFRLVQAAYAWRARRQMQRQAAIAALHESFALGHPGFNAVLMQEEIMAQEIQDGIDMENGGALACGGRR